MKTAALLITGNTYLARRELRAAGCIWNHGLKGYLSAVSDDIKALCERLNLIVEMTEADELDIKPAEGERLREIRQAKGLRTAEQLLERAVRLEKQADEYDTKIKPYDDYSFWTEPLKVGHHSYNRHKRLRDRLSGYMGKASELRDEARKLRKRAEHLQKVPAIIKGDAQRRREALHQERDKQIAVGTIVDTCHYGIAEVVKINKITYSVRLKSGTVLKHGKEFCQPVQQQEPACQT